MPFGFTQEYLGKNLVSADTLSQGQPTVRWLNHMRGIVTRETNICQ